MRHRSHRARQPLPVRSAAHHRHRAPWAAWISRTVVPLLILVTLAVFWRIHSHEFVLWDDPVNVSENPYLQSVTWNNTLAFWRAPYGQLYIPLTYTLWALTAAVSRWGTAHLPGTVPLDPALFHSLNLLLHLLSVLVVWRILCLLLSRTLPEAHSPATRQAPARVAWVAGGGALLFAVHPVQVEAVAWVTGLKDVLCGFLSYVAIWQYLRYASGSRAAPVSGPPARRQAPRVLGPYWLATGAFMLALLAKPTAVVVPVVVWLLDVWGGPQTWRTRRLAVLAWLVLAGLWGLFTSQSQPAYARAHYNLGNALMSQGKVQDAIPQYMAALRLQPALAEAQGNLGVALASQGRVAEARQHFAAVLRLDPTHAAARQFLESEGR